MLIVNHRTNTIKILKETPQRFGCEIDIRNHGVDLIVIHDPFIQEGPKLEEFLEEYKHQFLIINVKEEGLGNRIFQLLQVYNINEYFILDETVPFIFKHARAGQSNFAFRVSEFENYKNALEIQKVLGQFDSSLNWIWADTFTGEVFSAEAVKEMQKANYRCCFVSPELHRLDDPESWRVLIESFYSTLKDRMIIPDMICTKEPLLWEKLYNEN